MDREEFIARAEGTGTFFVSFWRRARGPQGVDSHPMHELVLRPILAKAKETRVYGLEKDRELSTLLAPISVQKSRSRVLDHGAEVLSGYEAFWNSYCKHSGIVIVTTMSNEDVAQIFKRSSKPNICSSHYQISKGSSAAAIRFCAKASTDDAVVCFLFPGSNGLQWVHIFTTRSRIRPLVRLAIELGRAESELWT